MGGLQVTVDHIVLSHKFKGVCKATEMKERLFLCKAAILLEVGLKVSASAEFHDKEYVLAVLLLLMEADDVGVFECGECLYFLRHIVFQLVIAETGAFNDLYGDFFFWVAMVVRNIHFTNKTHKGL